jgi:GT2 family glycosyltransferase
MTKLPDRLPDLVTLLVPAGRGMGSLAPLIGSLLHAARVGGCTKLPGLTVGVAGDDTVPSAQWRDAGGTMTIAAAASGHATALRNAAAAAVSTPWIAFLDDDVIVEDSYLRELESVCLASPDPVVQGVPFLCSNSHSLLARFEARNYEQGFARYYEQKTNTVRVIDARNLVMKTSVARAFPFNEGLIFAGEGQELARRLRLAGVRIGYREALRVQHRNRDTFAGLVFQKFMHGRGRAQRVRLEGGVWNHARRTAARHFLYPVKDALLGRAAISDAGYRLFTNSIFWCGVAHEAMQRQPKGTQNGSATP